MEFQICGLGNALMDVLCPLPSDGLLTELGLQKGTMHLKNEQEWQEVFHKIEHLPTHTHSGGSCANSMCTAALLGSRVAFCGQVGRDAFGKRYVHALVENGVHSFLHLLPEGNTGKCLSLISPDAERTMLTTLGCAIELETANLFTQVIEKAKVLHITGYLFTGGKMPATAKAAIAHARAHQIPISFDVSDPWVVSTFTDTIRDVAELYADIVFLNAAEARALYQLGAEAAMRKLAGFGKTVILKQGSLGSMIMRGNKVIQVPVHRVTAQDTTGAGDAYAGGFLHGWVNGWELEACGRLGSRVAAETVAQTGAVVSEPGKLRALLNEA